MINPVFSLNAAVLQKAASAQKLRGDTPLSRTHNSYIIYLLETKQTRSPSNTHNAARGGPHQNKISARLSPV